jgi:hypothetical protein
VTGFWERVTIVRSAQKTMPEVPGSAQPPSALPGGAPACLPVSGLQVDPRVMKGSSLPAPRAAEQVDTL